jgi:hypothetical protein
MKKLFVILSAVCLMSVSGQSLLADPVSPSRALEVGRKILDGPSTRSTTSEVSILWDSRFPDETKSGHPAFYVIGRQSGGFVIIAGDDNVQPVLAISDKNRFETENMPEHVRWWMDQMRLQVLATTVQTAEVRTKWARLLGTRADDWSLDASQVTDRFGHPTPEWGQGNKDPEVYGQIVFNKYCPIDPQTNTLSVTGCVATAIAEVMTTLSGLYPDKMPWVSTGSVNYSIPYGQSGRVAASPYELGNTVYDWDNLRTLTDREAIRKAIADGKTELLDNLAHLMADCGGIMEAMYSSEGTGAYTDYTPDRMSKHFFMNPNAKVRSVTSNWISLLKDELDKHPVLYSGSTKQYGHAFVFDGYGRYQGDDVFHVNFGWRGLCNGYYYHTNLQTDVDEVWKNCDAIFDFYPVLANLEITPGTVTSGNSTTSYSGITYNSAITAGTEFKPTVGLIKNTGEYYYGALVACLRHRDGTLVEIGSTSMSVNAGGQWNTSASSNSGWGGWGGWGGGWGSGNSLSCKIPSDTQLAFGDCIVLYYKSSRGLIPVPFDNDGRVHDCIPLFPTTFIKTEDSYRAGDEFLFLLRNFDGLYAGTTWTITDPSGNTVQKTQSDRKITLSQSGRYKIEAAIAPSEGDAVIEHVVTIINVQ